MFSVAAFRPGDFAAFQEAKNQKQFNNRGRNNTQYFSDSNGGYDFDGINYGYEMATITATMASVATLASNALRRHGGRC